jgi:CRISPR/Cas system CSM-associated protein Csm2 small subunit
LRNISSTIDNFVIDILIKDNNGTKYIACVIFRHYGLGCSLSWKLNFTNLSEKELNKVYDYCEDNKKKFFDSAKNKFKHVYPELYKNHNWTLIEV